MLAIDATTFGIYVAGTVTILGALTTMTVAIIKAIKGEGERASVERSAIAQAQGVQIQAAPGQAVIPPEPPPVAPSP